MSTILPVFGVRWGSRKQGLRQQEARTDHWGATLDSLAAGSCLVTSAWHQFRPPLNKFQLPSVTSTEGEAGHRRHTSPCVWPFPVHLRVLQRLYNAVIAVSREAWAANRVQEVAWSEKFWLMSHCWAALSPTLLNWFIVSSQSSTSYFYSLDLSDRMLRLYLVTGYDKLYMAYL